MNNKNLLERRFISRLEHTRAVFDYISLDTIVNGQLKQKIQFRPMNLKRIYNLTDIQRKRLPVPDLFKRIRKRNSNLS